MEYFLVIQTEDRTTMYGVLTVEFPKWQWWTAIADTGGDKIDKHR